MSAATITKRGNELKPGDVIADFMGTVDAAGPAVVLEHYINGGVFIYADDGEVMRVMIGYDSTVKVEAPALTPAQQHAEECFALLCYVCSSGAARDAWHDDYLALREKIDPPAPPTLEEALRLIELVAEEKMPHYDTYKTRKDWAVDILERAKRTGDEAMTATTKPTGGPAFPTNLDAKNMVLGLYMRDWFAGQALQGMASDANMLAKLIEVHEAQDGKLHPTIAAIAYLMADAMIAERAKL